MAQDPKGYCVNCRAIETAKPPDYASVQCPVYIIGGSVDKSAPATGCQFIHDSLVNAKERKIDIIKDMGHWYCVEDADIIGKLVGAWCSKYAWFIRMWGKYLALVWPSRYPAVLCRRLRDEKKFNVYLTSTSGRMLTMLISLLLDKCIYGCARAQQCRVSNLFHTVFLCLLHKSTTTFIV